MERERVRRRERGCAVIVTLKVWFDKLQCGVRLLNNICRHILISTLMPLQDFFVCPSQIRLGLVACYLYAQYFFTNRLLPANCGWSLKMSTTQFSGQFLVRIRCNMDQNLLKSKKRIKSSSCFLFGNKEIQKDETFWDLFTSYLKSSIHHRRQSPLHAGLMFGWLIVLGRLNFPWFVSIVCGRTTDCSPRQYFSEKV